VAEGGAQWQSSPVLVHPVIAPRTITCHLSKWDFKAVWYKCGELLTTQSYQRLSLQAYTAGSHWCVLPTLRVCIRDKADERKFSEFFCYAALWTKRSEDNIEQLFKILPHALLYVHIYVPHKRRTTTRKVNDLTWPRFIFLSTIRMCCCGIITLQINGWYWTCRQQTNKHEVRESTNLCCVCDVFDQKPFECTAHITSFLKPYAWHSSTKC